MSEENEMIEAEFEEVAPIVEETQELPFVEESEEEAFGDITDNYTDVDGKVVYVNPETGEHLDPNNLTPWEKIKFISIQIGQTIDEPKKDCKHCYGRGYTSLNLDDNSPVPCSCIYRTYRASNPSWYQIQSQTMKQNRKQKKAYQKQIGKYIKAMKPKYEQEQAKIEKSKANLGKNTPNYIPKALRETPVETVEENVGVETAEGVIGKVD